MTDTRLQAMNFDTKTCALRPFESKTDLITQEVLTRPRVSGPCSTISFLYPAQNPDVIQALQRAKVTSLGEAHA